MQLTCSKDQKVRKGNHSNSPCDISGSTVIAVVVQVSQSGVSQRLPMHTNIIPFAAAFTVILAYCTILRSLHFCPQFCHNNKKAQKYLLGGFECLVKLYQTPLLPRVPIILKDLYDADLLEEDVIIAWAEKVTCQHTAPRLDLESQMKRCSSELHVAQIKVV